MQWRVSRDPLALVIVITSTIIATTRVSADTPPVVIVYTPPSALLLPLTRELQLAGFQTIAREASAETVTEEVLRDSADSVGAIAVVRILQSDSGVQMFIRDPSSEVVVSTELIPSEAVERGETIVALKTVEILRASLLMVKWEVPPSPPPMPQTPSSPPPPTASPPNVSEKANASVAPPSALRGLLYLAPSATYGFGDIPPALHVAIGFSLLAFERFRLFLTGLVPTFRTTVERNDSSAAIREGMIAIGAAIDLVSPEHPVVPFLGIQGGVVFFDVEGEADAPFSGRESTGVAGGIHLNAGTTFRLNHILALRCDLSIGVLVPRPAVRFDGRVVASFGRPMLSGMAGLEVAIF
jgi:hypothetical protein